MTARRWPAIPKKLDGLAGPIKVRIRRVESFKAEDGDHVWGLYRPAVREIHLASKLPPAIRWHTLVHEWAHAWLLDSGVVNVLRGEGQDVVQAQELVCDSLASAFVRSFVRVTGIDPWAKEK
jgi:Zn-dependent peptidase ImmA (M78 family)